MSRVQRTIGSRRHHGNVISGNFQDGILIDGANATNNLVQANYIGLNAGGTSSVGNGGNGVEVQSSGNIISGCWGGLTSSPETAKFILIDGANATDNLVQINFIGLNASGTGNVGNGGNGVEIKFSNASAQPISASCPENSEQRPHRRCWRRQRVVQATSSTLRRQRFQRHGSGASVEIQFSHRR